MPNEGSGAGGFGGGGNYQKPARSRPRPQPHTEHGANIRGPVESGGYRQPYRQSNPSGTRNVLRRSPGPPRGSTGTGPSGRRVYHTKAGWQAIREANKVRSVPRGSTPNAPTVKFGAGLTAAQQGLLHSLLASKPPPSLNPAHNALAHLSHVNGGNVPKDFFKELSQHHPELKGKNPNDPNALYSVSEPTLKQIAHEAQRATGNITGYAPGPTTGGSKHDLALAKKEFQSAPIDDPLVSIDQAIPGPQSTKGTHGQGGVQSRIGGFAKDVSKSVIAGPKLSKNVQQDSLVAPALKVLGELARPAHALAGAELGFLKTKGSLAGTAKGAYEGGIKNKPIGFADVEKELGVPKGPFRTITGGVVDVATNPLNFTGAGPESVAARAAARAETRVVKKAVAKGMTPEAAKGVGKVAAKKAAEAAPKGTGVSIRLGGARSTRTVPGVTRATAAVGRTLRRLPGKGTASGVRAAAADVSPFVKPPGVNAAEAHAAEMATRTTRAQRNAGLRAAELKAKGLARRLKPNEHQAVIDALESGNINSLPAHLTKVVKRPDGSVLSIGVARELRDTFRHILRQQHAAGVPIGSLRDYFPHMNVEADVAAAEGRGVGGVGVRRVAPGHGRGRTMEGTLREQAPRGPVTKAQAKAGQIRLKNPTFSEHVPTVVANAFSDASKTSAQGMLHRGLASIGRSVKPGRGQDSIFSKLAPGEIVYRLHAPSPEKGAAASVLEELTPKQIAALEHGSGHLPTMRRAAAKSGKKTVAKAVAKAKEVPAGQYFIANKAMVDKALEAGGQPVGREDWRGGLGRGIDRATGFWKRLATSTPGFNVRNFVGDTEMAYRVQPARKIPRNLVQAGRTVKAAGRSEKAMARGVHPKPGKAGINLPEGHQTYEQLAKGATGVGAMRAGYIGRELTDLQHKPLQEATGEVSVKPSLTTRAIRKVGAKKAQPAPGQHLNRLLQNREDVPRMSTYHYFQKLGFSDENASRLANREHIDYGNLTPVEKSALRRVFPFYTFTSRNIPNVARTLVQRPGKFSNYELTRENAAKAMGLPASWQGDMTEAEQRQAGIPANLKSLGLRPESLSESLPLVDLNEIPVGVNPVTYGTELAHKMWSLMNPMLRVPIELQANYNDFFRGPIQDKDHKLVAAPWWAQYLPNDAKKALGVVPDYVDPQSGKETWGWEGKAGYVAQAVQPGLPTAANNLLTTGNQKGQSLPEKLLGTPTLGLKATPLAPQKAKATLQQLYTRKTQLEGQRGALYQRGFSKDHDPGGQLRKVAAQIKKNQQDIYNGSAAAGTKKPKQGAPPKPKRRRWGVGSSNVGGVSYRPVR